MKRLFIAGLVLVLLGGSGWVVYSAARGKKCPFRCAKKSSPIASEGFCKNKKEASVPTMVSVPAATAESSKRIDLDFDNAQLSVVVEKLASEGANVVYSAPSLADRVVTVHLTQVPLGVAVECVLKSAGVKYEVKEQVIVVVGR